MNLRDKLLKNTTVKETATLSESKIYGKKDMIPTSVPMINVALGGTIDGGLTPGLTVLAGPSKHFKTGFSLLMAQSFLKKYPDGIILFYDSEFGTPQEYFNAFGIPSDSVVHTPITDIEQLKFDVTKQLQELGRDDHVLIVVDSVGNLASKKEVEDALNEKSVADMTRAKALKSIFRIVTPHLTIKDIPMVVVNHTYKEQSLFPKDIVSGGCVVAGTKIVMSDGSLKNVEDIQPGEFVQTIYNSKEVTHAWNPETLEDGNPECYEIEFEDGHSVVCSAEHKFWIDNQWVAAKDLVVGDDCGQTEIRVVERPLITAEERWEENDDVWTKRLM